MPAVVVQHESVRRIPPADSKFQPGLGIAMFSDSTPVRPAKRPGFVRTGLWAGLAGGLAELSVIWLYWAQRGGDADILARYLASGVGLDASPAIGVAVRLVLAAALGIGLSAVIRSTARRPARDGLVFSFMLGSLTAVWAANIFIVLPATNPAFAHLLPDPVTLVAKWLFGLAAAATLCALTPPDWALSADRRDQGCNADVATGITQPGSHRAFDSMTHAYPVNADTHNM